MQLPQSVRNQYAETRVSQQNFALIFLETGESDRNKLEFDPLCWIDLNRLFPALVKT